MRVLGASRKENRSKRPAPATRARDRPADRPATTTTTATSFLDFQITNISIFFSQQTIHSFDEPTSLGSLPQGTSVLCCFVVFFFSLFRAIESLVLCRNLLISFDTFVLIHPHPSWVSVLRAWGGVASMTTTIRYFFSCPFPPSSSEKLTTTPGAAK